VLKTFRDGHADTFKDEREAFWALREHEGMIRYLGDFSHPNDPSCRNKQENGPGETGEGESILGDETITGTATASGEHVGRMTTNILLEWGETDLEDFFAERQPPVLGSEVRIFWKELFGVAEALQRVHNFSNKYGQEFDGYVLCNKIHFLHTEELGGMPTSSQTTYFEYNRASSSVTQDSQNLCGGSPTILYGFQVVHQLMVREILSYALLLTCGQGRLSGIAAEGPERVYLSRLISGHWGASFP
jgi:hypothetical protein